MCINQFEFILSNLTWNHQPEKWCVGLNNSLLVIPGKNTDIFINPFDLRKTDNAPAALIYPADKNFIFGAKVTVDFNDVFDAAVLLIKSSEDTWAKLCFEYSPELIPTVVSVVTQGTSDDCSSSSIIGNQVYLRISVHPEVIGFHYSLDGIRWNFVRQFKIVDSAKLKIGFAAQSPIGKGCKVIFSEIFYKQGSITNFRNGE